MAMLARKLRSLRPERVLEVDVDHVDEEAEEPRLSRGWCMGLLLAWAFVFSTSVAVVRGAVGGWERTRDVSRVKPTE